MRSAIINIDNGTIVALAGGPISLASLGERSTKRVSHIEFDDNHQLWQVKNPAFPPDDHRHVMAEFDDYDRALEWERDYFNTQLQQNFHGE